MKTRAVLKRVAVIFALGTLPGYGLETVIRYPAPQQRNLNTICWTGTQFVAAGDQETVLTSPDGNTWTVRAVPGGEAAGVPPLLSSACGGGRIVLGSTASTVLTSTDGVTWNAATVPSQYPEYTEITQLAWNGAVFRANSTGSGENWRSTDGVVWTKLTSTASTSRISVQGSDFIAWPPYGTAGQPQILLRDQGTGWTNTTTDLTQPMWHVEWTGVRYVTVGKSGAAATSSDGISWTSRTTGVTAELTQIVWSGSVAVAVGTGGTIVTSPNGATWSIETSGTVADLNAIAWSGSAFVAVGAGGTILRSPDGKTWTAQAGTALVDVTGVAWTGTAAVAVGGAGGTLFSNDGISWARTAATTGPRGSNLRIAAGAGKLVAAATHGLWTAPPDASSWSDGAQLNTTGTAVAWDGQRFVALCQAFDGAFSWHFFITRSTDGLAWTELSRIRIDPSYEITEGPRDDLVFTGSLYLASLRKSPDAVTWTEASVPDVPFLLRTEQGVIGVGKWGDIHTSPDGESWTLSIPIPQSWGSPGSSHSVRGVAWTGFRMLATVVADNAPPYIYEAGPGRPWSRILDNAGASIAWTGNRALVATGSTIFSIENPDASLPPTWRLWLQNHFTAAQLNDPSITGALADPDGDGQVNAVEFMAATSPVSLVNAPVFTVVPPQGNQSARFQWQQDTGRNGVQVRAEVSPDLDVWDVATITPLNGAAGGLRTMQATAPPGLTKVYFRLKVILTE